MTGINNPFSQFNIPYAPARNQNNVSARNNVATNEQTVQSNKKQFAAKDLLIPAGTTAAGGIGGFATGQLNKSMKNKNTDKQIKEHKAALLKKFNENSDVKIMTDNIRGGEELLKTLKNSINYAENMIADENSPKKLTELNKSLNRTIKAKEYQESYLNKLNISLRGKYTDLVEKPLREYTENLTGKVAKYSTVFTKKAVAAGIFAGIIIGGAAAFCAKKQTKGKNIENNNAILK